MAPHRPSPVAPGGVITPPSTAPPLGLTWTLFDTRGNELYSVTGVFPPGSGSASYLQTTYQLFNGNSVTLNGINVTCAASAPSPSQPCATINADGVVTQLAYDSAGDLTSSATPDGNGTENATSSYAYDSDGERTSVTAPAGNVPGANAGNYTTVTIYDADGRQQTVTRAGGTGATVTPRTTVYGYDANGSQTTVREPRGFTTTTTYNADGQATLVQDADGHYTLTCYDGDGNTAQTVPAVGVAASGLTPASCPTSYPSGYSDRLAPDATVSTFNALGQQTQQTTPAPAGQSGYETTAFTYDGNGRTIRINAPPTGNSGTSQVTVNSYNNAGELMSETIGYGTSAASTTTYCYDPAGNKTAVVAPDGNTSGIASCQTTQPWTVSSSLYPAQAAYQTTYSYDSANEQVSSTAPATAVDPSGATTTYTYDPAGNKLTATDPAQITTTWTYTPAGQVASASYSGSAAPAVRYGYDADGNKTGMNDGSGASSYTYDPFDELISQTNGAGQTTGYGYNPDGGTASITYPLPSGATWAATSTLSYGYDNADQLASVTDFNNNSIAVTDSVDGLPAAETLGSTGDTIATTYASTDSPSSIALKNSSSTLQSFTYGDAPSRDILTETDLPSSSSSPAAYSYDSQRRVNSMTPGTESQLNYGFDASGNLTALPAGATATYDHAGEIAAAVLGGNTTSYSYSADGERLTATQSGAALATAAWNGDARLTDYHDAAAMMGGAIYDGTGMRTSAAFTPNGGASVTERYVWNGDRLLMDSDNAYIYADQGQGSAPVEQVNLATGTATYLIADRLGSVRGTVDSTGTLTGTTGYDAWGNPQSPGGLTVTTPFGYAGGYTDSDGLIYLANRYYDPATGQFISLDPQISMTQQPYAYANDNPVNAKDPNGLATLGACAGAGLDIGIKVRKGWHIGAGGCINRTVMTPWDDIGLTGTVFSGVGIGKGSWSAGLYVELSNAKRLQQLGGWFEYQSASVATSNGFGISVVYFWGGPVIGIDLGLSLMGPAVYYVPRGVSDTWVNKLNNPWEANGARIAWDYILGGGFTGGFMDAWLNFTRWLINHRRR